MTSWSYLNHLCYEGLAKRYPDMNADGEIDSTQGIYNIKERLEYELIGYSDHGICRLFPDCMGLYQLFAKSHGIAVGPGRGSAAGSVVSYCLGHYRY